MNLHAIVSPAIGIVNPPVFCTVRISSGYTISADGTQVPAYSTADDVPVQVQAMTYTDLMQMDSLNIQGTRRKGYFYGNIEGLNRSAMKGGDIVIMPNLPTFPGPTLWLVATVLEHFEGWTSVALTLQSGAVPALDVGLESDLGVIALEAGGNVELEAA